MFRSYIENDKQQDLETPKAVLHTYTQLLPGRPLNLPPLKPGSDIRRVSVLSPFFGRGPHLGAVSNFVSALLSMQSLDQVDVVFSADVHPRVWQPAVRNRQIRAFADALNSSNTLFYGSQNTRTLWDKLNIVTAPEAEQLANAIGDGATTAKLALRKAVPVLVCRNDARDISNMFPDPPQHQTFPELITHLADWAADPDKRADYLKHQLANINRRADLGLKSAELETIFTRATGLFHQRRDDFI